MNKSDTLLLLNRLTPFDTRESEFLERTLDFIGNTDKFWSAQNSLGHITASAWIVTEDGAKALLLFNNKFGMWPQAGGHPETTDASLVDAAKREGLEETGVRNLKAVKADIFDIDVHNIPEKKGIPAHTHYDVRFIFSVAQEDAALILLNHEADAYKWVDIEDLLVDSVGTSLQRMARKTKQLFSLNNSYRYADVTNG